LKFRVRTDNTDRVSEPFTKSRSISFNKHLRMLVGLIFVLFSVRHLVEPISRLVLLGEQL